MSAVALDWAEVPDTLSRRSLVETVSRGAVSGPFYFATVTLAVDVDALPEPSVQVTVIV